MRTLGFILFLSGVVLFTIVYVNLFILGTKMIMKMVKRGTRFEEEESEQD